MAVPPALLCKQFSQLVMDLDSCTPSVSDTECFHQLYHEMLEMLESDADRLYQLREILQDYGFCEIQRRQIDGKIRISGSTEVLVNSIQKEIIYLVLEVNNEFQIRDDTDCLKEAAKFWQKSIRKIDIDSLERQSNFPVAMLVQTGERDFMYLFVCPTFVNRSVYFSCRSCHHITFPSKRLGSSRSW